MVSKKRKDKFSFSEEYSLCWSFIKETKGFILSIILIFFAFLLIGFFVPLPVNLANQILEFIRGLLAQTEGLDSYGMIRFIFVNNLLSSLQGMVLGAFFGILPLISAISNGFILGFVAKLSVHSGGLFSLWRVFPHGIFELPAVFISLGLGLRIGTFVFKKEKIKTLVKDFYSSVRVFVFVIIPLLIIAAIIEGLLISLA